MSDVQTQGNFSIPAGREALRFLRKKGSGSLLITSGLQDLRLVLDGREISVEAEGFQTYGEEERDLVRTFLCTVFWEHPTFFLDPEGGPGSSTSSISINASQYEVLNLMDRGLIELTEIQSRVTGMDLLVSVSGSPPPGDIRSGTANLFRVLSRLPKGGHLGSAAEQARIDVLDAAWAINDLLEADQVSIRRPPAPMIMRRLAHAEAFADRGLLPAARYTHIARGFTRSDPGRAARLYQDAATSFLISGHPDEALQSFRVCFELAADNVAALEGMANALEELKRPAESKRLREKLVKLYLRWNMPARARQQLDKIPQQTPEQRSILLDCMLRTKDFDSAASLASKIIPNLSTADKVKLAERFAQAGARGRKLAKIVALCGLHSLGPAKTVLRLLTVLALAAVCLLGGEVYLRTQFKAASKAVEAKLAEAQFSDALAEWNQLAEWDEKIGASTGDFPTCLARMGDLTRDLKDLQTDVNMLKANPKTLALLKRWADPTKPDLYAADILNDLPALEGIVAQSDQLQTCKREALARVDDFRAEAEAKVSEYKDSSKRLKLAKVLVTNYRNVRTYPGHSEKKDLFKGLTLKVKIGVTPKSNDGASVYLEIPGSGNPEVRLPDPPNNGAWQVRLALDNHERGVVLRIVHDGQGKKKFVPQTLHLKLLDLAKTALELKLVSVKVASAARTKPLPDELENALPVFGKPVAFHEAKKGGRWTVDFKAQGIEPDPDFQPTDLNQRLAPSLPEGYRAYVQTYVFSRNFSKLVVTEAIQVWVRDDDDTMRSAAITSLAGYGGQKGLNRIAKELNKGKQDWVISGFDRAKDMPRLELVQQAIEHTIKKLVEALK